MPRKSKTAREPAEAPQGYAILSHDDLQSAFACDDFAGIVRYYQQNPAPDRVSTAMLVEWLGVKARRRGRPPADDVRRDAENAVIELAVAGNAKGRKEGRFRAATSLRCSESKITHALSRTRGK